MKSKDKKDLFSKTINELKNLLRETENELFNLKLELSQNKLKNKKEVFYKRKKVAVILTAIREKELVSEIASAKSKGEGAAQRALPGEEK